MIRPAELGWRNGLPFARDFGDIYHSADAAGETNRVFVGPARVAQTAARAAGEGGMLRVGELGFGTGLNFAVVAALALKANCRLHFISFDARPIDPVDFAEIAGQRRTRLPVYGSLAGAYPPLLAGWHRRVLAEGRIWLSLYWGDAEAGLADLIGRQRQPVDAWFLDGFAPDKNPEMWSRNLLGNVARLSGAGTAVATFSAAGRVRRRLESCGFAMRRIDQRPHKRESLAGVYMQQGLCRETPCGRVAVAGAGIAGASMARHLAETGIAVNLFDPAAAVAAGASRIPAMLLHPRLLGDLSRHAQWRVHAYAYSRAWTRRFRGFVETGVLQTCGPNLDRDKMRRIAAVHAGAGLVDLVSGSRANAMSGWTLAGDVLYFPGAGIVEPAHLIRALVDHPGISVHLEQRAPVDGRPLVLACAGEARAHAQARYLETAEVHGQVDIVTMNARPRLAIVGDGYLAPTSAGVVAGATYEHAPWPDGRSTASNLEALGGRGHRWIGKVRATRTIASDRMPIVGKLGPDLYVSTAHGSMGTVSAPFAAAIVASLCTGEFAPLDRAVEALVAPARFRQRQARRGYRMGAVSA